MSCATYLSNQSNKFDRSNWPICQTCFAAILLNTGFFCPVCRRRLPEPKTVCHPASQYVLAAAASYQDKPVRELIHSLKYENSRAALKPLAEILKKYLQIVGFQERILTAETLVVPVPLHKKKERERGFNQAALIASTLLVLHYGEAPTLRTEMNNLVRIKNTESQTKISEYKEKEINIAGCFRLNNPARLAGKNIILVDDVFTSGATMNEAVRLFQGAGAGKIIAVVIAKT